MKQFTSVFLIGLYTRLIGSLYVLRYFEEVSNMLLVLDCLLLYLDSAFNDTVDCEW